MHTGLVARDRSCCFWIKKDFCSHAAKGGILLAAALIAIAAIGCVLFLLAQQGYDLGGINSFAQVVDPYYLYLITTVTTISGVLFLSLACWQSCAVRSKTAVDGSPIYTPQYLRRHFGDQKFESQILALQENLPPGFFRKKELEIPRTQHTVVLYAINQEGVISTHCCKPGRSAKLIDFSGMLDADFEIFVEIEAYKKTLLLQEVLPEAGDAYAYEFKKYYLWTIRLADGQLSSGFAIKEYKREQALKGTNNLTRFINKIDQKILKIVAESHIKDLREILIEEKHCRIALVSIGGHNLELLFFRKNGNIVYRIFPLGKGANFIAKEQLIEYAKKERNSDL